MNVSTHPETFLTNTKLQFLCRLIRPRVDALWTKVDKYHTYDL